MGTLGPSIIVVASLACGCGRIGFEAVGEPDAPGSQVSVDWAKGFGGGLDDGPTKILRDAAGNLFLVGAFYSGAFSFGGAPVTGNGEIQGYIASFTAAGDHRWSRGFTSTETAAIHDAALDSAGNLYVAGTFESTLSTGGADLTSVGLEDAVVASYDTNGGHRWSVRMGGTGEDYAFAITVARDDTIVIAGAFEGAAMFGTEQHTSNGMRDIFVAGLTSDGTFLSALSVGGLEDDQAQAVAVDASNNMYVLATFEGSIDLGGVALLAGGTGPATMIASFGVTGHRWSKKIAQANDEHELAMFVGSDDHVYVSGAFTSAANLGGGTLVPVDGVDAFVGSFTSSGSHRWSFRAGGPGLDAAPALVESADGLYVGGRFASSIDLPGGALSSAGLDDLFLAAFSTAGAPLWTRRFGGPDVERIQSIAATPDGLVATGMFTGTTPLGDGLSGFGGLDIFVMHVTVQ